MQRLITKTPQPCCNLQFYFKYNLFEPHHFFFVVFNGNKSCLKPIKHPKHLQHWALASWALASLPRLRLFVAHGRRSFGGATTTARGGWAFPGGSRLFFFGKAGKLQIFEDFCHPPYNSFPWTYQNKHCYDWVLETASRCFFAA